MSAHFATSLVCAALCCAFPLVGAASAAESWLSEGESAAFAREVSVHNSAEVLEPDDLYWDSAANLSRWSVRAGAVILQRSSPSSIAIINSLTGPTLLNARDFGFAFQGGPDIYVKRRGQRADLDFRYFGVNGWQSPTQNLDAPDGVEFQFADPSQTQVNTAINLNSTYFSSLNSAEANLRRNVTSRLTLLAGFRYLSLRERLTFGAMLPDRTPLFNAEVGAVNNLCGLQIGADDILWDNGGRLHVDGVIKAGVFGNAAQNSLQIQQDDGSGSLSKSRAHTAFVGEIGLTGVFQITQHIAARLGYQVLWISGVAVASDQFHVINPSDNGGILSVDTSGGALYHGALAGLECAW